MEHSVNGNIKQNLKREGGGFAGYNAGTAASAGIFLMGFSCSVNEGLGSSFKL